MQPNTLLDALLDEAGHLARRTGRPRQPGRPRPRPRAPLRTHRRGTVVEGPAAARPGARPDLRSARRPAAPARHARRHRPRGARRTPSAPHGTSLSGFVERATALWRSDEQQRPHILGAPAVTGTPAVMPVWEWENPPEDADVSRGGRHRVSTADIEMLRAARAHYELMYRKAGGIATRTRIVGFLNAETAPAAARQLHRRARPPTAPRDRRPRGGRGHLRVRLRRARPRPALLPPGASARKGERGPGTWRVCDRAARQPVAVHARAPAGGRLRGGGAAGRGPAHHPGARRRPVRDAGQGVRPSRRRHERPALHPARRAGGRAHPPRATSRTRPATSSPGWSTSRWRRPC